MPVGMHRTIAKHSYLTGKDKGFGRAKAHINYIQFRAGKDQQKEERSFFNAYRDDIYNKELKEAISNQNPRGTVMHKIILSPGVEGADIKEYARGVMTELCSKKGQDLEWYAVAHGNTDNAHCHIVVMGRDENGRDVRIYKKDYEVIKEAGDQYLERNKLLDRHKDRDKEKDDRAREEREKEIQRQDQERTEQRTREDQECRSQREEEDKRRELERQQEDKQRDKELSDELAELRALEDEERQLERDQQDQERAEAREKEDREKELLRTRERETLRIEREKADREQEREPNGKGAASLVFEAMKAAAKEFARVLGKDEKEKEPGKKETEYQKRRREKQEEKERESKLLGDDLDIDAKLLIEQKSEERQQAEKEKAWKEYVKPVEVAYPLADGSVHTFQYDRSNSLESLKELSKDYEDKKEIARNSLSEEEHKRVKSWIKEKTRENKRVEDKADKLPEIALSLDSENKKTWSKESRLEDLRRLEEMNKSREVYLDDVEQKALDNWINAQELKEPIRIELERADGPLLYERDDSSDALSLLLEEYETGKQEDMSKKDYEKLKTWLDEKSGDKFSPPAALPAERISIYEKAENRHYDYDRNSDLGDLRGLARGFERDESQLTQKEYKELKVWIADKEYVEAARAQERADRERVEAAKQKEIAEREAPILVFEPAENQNHEYDRNSSLAELQGLQASHEREEIALSEKQAEKLKDWLAEKEYEKWKEPIEYSDQASRAEPNAFRGMRHLSKDEKIDTLRDFEKVISDGGPNAPKLKEEDHERLKEWIKDKDEKEIEYGDQVYSKETPLEKLQQFRENLLDSKYEQWIEKEKFSRLCSWIGIRKNQEEREQKEKEARERAEKEVKEIPQRPRREPRAKSGRNKESREQSANLEDRDIDEDAIKYGDHVYTKDTPLAELKEFREGLLEKRFDEWIDRDKFSKLSSWVATKEAHGEDAYKKKSKEKDEGKSRSRGGDKDVYVPKRKLSALEKRMQRAVRQEKAERLKAYYEEKALNKERLEKELHEIKWERMSADKPVLQFVNLLRMGANKLKEEKEREAKIKERDLQKLSLEKDLEKPGQKSDAKPAAKPVVLPYLEPKSRLEELANKMALEREQLNKTKAEHDKELEKNTGGKIPDKPTKAIDKPKGKDEKNSDKSKESKTKDREEKSRDDDDDRGGR